MPSCTSAVPDYPVVGSGDFDHYAAKARLKELKREAEARRRRQAEINRRESDILREQLESEEIAARRRQEDRDADAQLAKEEQHRRFENERSHRLQMMRELRKMEAAQKAEERPKPLFKRREEEAKAQEAKDDAKRRDDLRQKRALYEPIDFKTLAAEARELRELGDASGGTGGSGRIRKSSAVPLPPMKHYYQGAARERVVQQAFEQRKKVELAREKARANKNKSRQYAKLVSELVEVDSSRSRPSFDPARLCLPPPQLVSESCSACSTIGSCSASARAVDVSGGSKQQSAGGGSAKPAPATSTPHSIGLQNRVHANETAPSVRLPKELEQRAASLNKELCVKQQVCEATCQAYA